VTPSPMPPAGLHPRLKDEGVMKTIRVAVSALLPGKARGSWLAVWQDVPKAQRLLAMRQAASARDFMLRVRDVSIVLNQLEKSNQPGDHALAGRLDLKKVGMSGHSFGAVTTQAVSGPDRRRGHEVPSGDLPVTATWEQVRAGAF